MSTGVFKLSPWLSLSALLHLTAGTVLWQLNNNDETQKVRVAGQQVLSISLVDSVASPPPLQQEVPPLQPEAIKQAVQREVIDKAPAPVLKKPRLQPEPVFIKEVIETPEPPVPNLASIDAAAAAQLATEPTLVLREASFNADYLHNPKPEYPSLSMRLGEQGKVLLHVHVSEAGEPLDVVIKSSSGYQRLDRAAMEVVKHWQFVPAKQGMMALESWVDVPVQFSLEK